MPRTRVTEVPQRPSRPPTLRTSSSNSDPLHHCRSRTDRSPRLSDGRSPRGSQSDPLNKKKLGTRISDLESQLGQAQGELKSLKDQLASAEAAKKAAQEKLEKKSKKPQNNNPGPTVETSDDVIEKETDVFEVPIEKVNVDPKPEISSFDEVALKKDKIDEKDKELEAIRQENENLKIELNEKSVKLSSAQSEIEGLTEKLSKADQEVETSKAGFALVSEKLEATERAKEELENEMRRLRVQTEQWRKAADAAALVLAGGVEGMSGRRISERCGSMDKHYGNNVFEGGYGGYVGSPGLVDDSDDVFGGSGKKKGGSGLRKFGDLWKKKGQK